MMEETPLFLNILNTPPTATTMVLPLQDRARVYRTWSVCRAEESRQSADFGKEVPNTAETSFQMHGCRNWRMRGIKQGLWTTQQHCFAFYIQNAYTLQFCIFYQKIERSEVSTSISTSESTIFVWKIMVFIILPSSLWSANPRLAFETLVYACKKKEGMQKRNEGSVSIRLNEVGRIRQTNLSTPLLICAVRSFLGSLVNKGVLQSYVFRMYT